MSDKVNEPTHQDDESESFYLRWSKRKTQDRLNLPKDNSSASATDPYSALDVQSDQVITPDSRPEKLVLSDQDMPDIDSLDEDSDYRAFLSPGVSEELRRMALRKLFQGQSFNLCDGLDDYDEEFTSFEKLGDIVTADMRFQLEEEAKRQAQLVVDEQPLRDGEPVNIDDGLAENELNATENMDKNREDLNQDDQPDDKDNLS